MINEFTYRSMHCHLLLFTPFTPFHSSLLLGRPYFFLSNNLHCEYIDILDHYVLAHYYSLAFYKTVE